MKNRCNILFLVAMLCLPLGTLQAQKPDQFRKALWVWKGLLTGPDGRVSASVLDGFVDSDVSVLFLSCDLNFNDWGFLDSLITECHKRKMQLHPYITPGHANRNNFPLVMEHPDWLVSEMNGNKRTNLNLANPEVRQYIVKLTESMLKHDIDGFHLDYIRFDLNQNYSYDSLTCATFKKEYGYSPMELDKDCGDPLWCVWIKWNANQVTELVREIRQAIQQSGKKIPLSAAVFPDPEVARIMIGQDWEAWVRDGLLDLVCPMLYIDNTKVFTQDTRNAIKICKGKAEVYIGIWLGYKYHRDVRPDLMLEHARIAKQAGADGISFWSGASFTPEYRAKLKELDASKNK